MSTETASTSTRLEPIVSLPSVGSWWTYQNQRYQVRRIEDGVVYAGRGGRQFFVDEASVKITGWHSMFSPVIDCCPMTGEPDCKRCSGEYCDFHFDRPCDCEVCERHGLGEQDLAD